MSVFSYFWIEFVFQEELIIGLAIISSILVIVESLTFRKKEKDSIELGEKYDFKKFPWFRTVYPLLIFVLFAFIYNSAVLDLFPEAIERTNSTPLITLLMLVPGLLKNSIAILISETKTLYYATEEGLLKSMRSDEIKKWNDFYGYMLVEDKNILRFKTKNLKYFSIQYDEEYFHQYRKEIISFLDSKLTRI